MMDYKKLRSLGKGILFGIGALIFAAVLALLFGWILMLLWNWLMPEIFGLPMIGYWQAWGLILLSHLLFKGGGAHGSSRKGHHFHPGQGRRPGRRAPHMHDNEDFNEFKKEFKDRMRSRWHDHEDCEGDKSDDEEIIPRDDRD
jgi:hypothetical protein